MNEETIRTLVRLEVMSALRAVQAEANSEWYRSETGSAVEAASQVLRDAMNSAADMIAEEADQFPEMSAQDYADAIKKLIDRARTDGYLVWTDPVSGFLHVGEGSDSSVAFGESEPPHIHEWMWFDDDMGHSGIFCKCGEEKE